MAAGLKFDPVGGGQFKQAVQQIIEAERQPIKQLEARKKNEEARVKLFQEFKGKFNGFDKTLQEFADFKKFRELKVDLGEGAGFVGVTIDKERAEPGTYTLEIEQLARKSSVISNGFEDPDEPVLGVGFVVAHRLNGESLDIYVDSDHSSLRGVASVINRQEDSPVQASVIQDISDPKKPWKLLLTGKKDGFEDRVEFPEFYFLDGTEEFYFDEKSDAENAKILLDGFPLEMASNNIKDFVSGVNVQLKQATGERSISFSISEDYQKISGKVKAMVDQVNTILEFINKQNQVDDKSDTRTTFAGDTGMQNIEYRLRNVLHEGFPVGSEEKGNFRYVWLNQLGIQFEKNGQLKFSEEAFTKNLQKDFEGVTEAITGEWGLARQLREVVAGYTRTPDGMLTMREQGLRNRITKIDNDIAVKERRIDQRAEALTAQFSRLQASLSNLQRQQQYLSSVLPGGGGGNMVAQLLGG